MILCGIDIGSTGCKCVAFCEDGQQLYTSYKEYDSVVGQVDMDAESMFASVLDVIKDCAAHVERSEIAALAVTSFGESFVPVDKDGKALSKIIMYTAKRGEAELEMLINRFGEKKIVDVTCSKPDVMYSLPKMAWTMKNIPDVQKNIYKFFQIQDYICFKLSGEAYIDYSLACRSMAFDVENRTWWSEILQEAGISVDHLPKPIPTGSVMGKIRKEIADAIGLSYQVDIVLGGHDQVAASVGAGVLEKGMAVDGTGTVECVTPLFDHIIRDEAYTNHNFVCVPHEINNLFCTYAFNFTGGVLLKWFRDNIATGMKVEAKKNGISCYKLFDDMCPKDPSDIIVIPHLLGAGGTPDIVGSATATITGLKPSHGLPDLYRAMLEGLSFEMVYNMELLENSGIKIDSLMATGGGARSSIWLQVKSDVFGKKIVPVKTDEAGAQGCAMAAAVAKGCYADLKEAAKVFVKRGEAVYPNDTNHAFYSEKYEKYKTVRNTMLDLYR